jgi:2'-5' RNA ligase
MIRAFIAIDLPNEFHAKISDIQSKLCFQGLRLVDPNLVHITLKFLGDVDVAQLSEINNALDNLFCSSFESHVCGVNVFPGIKSPRIVWIGANGDYSCIYKQVESSMYKIGFKKESRKFTPHATIARVKHLSSSQSKELASVIGDLWDFDVGSMHVDTIKLKKSTLTPQGPIYETLHEVRLP